MQHQELAHQLRVAAVRVWRQMPLGVRIKIAVRRMLAQIHEGIGEAIVVILADHGFNVPRTSSGKVDVRDPSVKKLGVAIYQKVRGVIKNHADAEDVIADTFERVFLVKRNFAALRGDSLSDYVPWILTTFHNAARDFTRSRVFKDQYRSVDIAPQDPDRPSDRQKLEVIETHLRNEARVPWELHPMWEKVKRDVMKALQDFDRKEKSKSQLQYEFPTKRVFELMIRDGLDTTATARKLVEEGRMEVEDPRQLRHALGRLRSRMEKVVETVVKRIRRDKELLDSFFDTLAA